MNTLITFFASNARLSIVALIPVSLTYAQTQLHPQVDDQTTYFPMTLTLADTGVAGNMVIWDFSTAIYEPNEPVNYTYRLPSPNEQTLHPEVTIVEEGTNGTKRLLHDSVTFLKQYQYVNPQFTVFTYTQPATMFTFPVLYGANSNTNAEVFYIGGVSLDVLETTECSVSGFGTLITPLETFDNVYKLIYHHTREYYNTDTLVTTIHIIESKWISMTENAVLLSLLWSDLDNQTIASFRSNASSAGLPNEDLTDLLIYPNPATGFVYLSKEVDAYVLIDQTGRTILSGKGSFIDLTNVGDGSYRLQLEKDDVILNRPIQVKG
ncbi:MAG: hypothetical protein QE487_00215 [Fluviicola sp.]|nr:hypothetical protein [Fluviicola sp.]